MAMYMAVESGQPTTPVVCLAGANEAQFGEPQLLRNVWVVPVSQLVAWLESRPFTLGREEAAKAVTRAMTSFPSTTTDPELLAAMGAAALATKRPRRRGAATRRPAARTNHQSGKRGQRRSGARPAFAARTGRMIGRLFLGFLVFALCLAFVPPLLTAAVKQLATSGDASSAPSGTPVSRSAATRSPASKPKAPVAAAPPDCSTATGPQIAKIVGRKVHPVAVSGGCVWGARLDDPSTALVTITMSASHAAYDTQLVTSVKQHRAVYASTLDSHFRAATAVWVATGQPITKGKSGVTARADTKVVVARTALAVSDDTARRMALAIAAAANTTG